MIIWNSDISSILFDRLKNEPRNMFKVNVLFTKIANTHRAYSLLARFSTLFCFHISFYPIPPLCSLYAFSTLTFIHLITKHGVSFVVCCVDVVL